MTVALCIAGTLAAAWALAYFRSPAWLWTLAAGVAIWGYSEFGGASPPVLAAIWIVFAVVAVLFNVPALRRNVVAAPLLDLFKRILPQVSQTEQEALDAGTVWWDGDLF